MSSPSTKIVNFMAISLLTILPLNACIVINEVILSNSTALAGAVTLGLGSLDGVGDGYGMEGGIIIRAHISLALFCVFIHLCTGHSDSNTLVFTSHYKMIIHNVSPFERLYGTPSSYSNLKVFGCDIVLNIKVFVVEIPSHNAYVYLAMSLFGNITCFLVFLHSMPLYLDLPCAPYAEPEFAPVRHSSEIRGTPLYLEDYHSKYAPDLSSTQSGITDSATSSTPLDPNVNLTSFDGVPFNDSALYRELVGSLIYLTMTCLDIAYAVHIVNQCMAASRTIHFTTVLSILRYVKDTLEDPPLVIVSILVMFSSLGDKKQAVVSRCITESEYCALVDATSELIWLCWLLTDMGALQQSPIILDCDNCSVIQIAHNDVFHKRTKHIEKDCHFVRHHL
ncbi:putative mitochondrial protein [Cucumis melo var. makuwa]|uniref:Putative mitochondrial protein n=1 Tax=Cucumis melo var. makuwa TaxID=1194695 RepID=A0A5D3E215_CUCMM|nr:putative mitochondrial protein [Cucumis melo var. makuwa]